MKGKPVRSALLWRNFWKWKLECIMCGLTSGRMKNLSDSFGSRSKYLLHVFESNVLHILGLVTFCGSDQRKNNNKTNKQMHIKPPNKTKKQTTPPKKKKNQSNKQNKIKNFFKGKKSKKLNLHLLSGMFSTLKIAVLSFYEKNTCI